MSPEEQRDKTIEERTEIWKKARAQHQRFMQLALWRSRTVQGIEQLLKRAAAVNGFTWTLNEAHRAFIMSADMISEADAAPWAKEVAPKGACFDQMLAFLATKGGGAGADFVFAFDGRLRAVRRTIEDVFNPGGVTPGKNIEELWIVYSGTGGGIGSRRRVCLASNTKEVGYVRLPCARVRLTTKPRTHFSGAGETSTHNSTFTSVPLPRLPRLPQIKLVR